MVMAVVIKKTGENRQENNVNGICMLVTGAEDIYYISLLLSHLQ